MLSHIPDFADPWRLCEQGKTFEGRVALDKLSRLAPLLASTDGEAAFVLVFAKDAEKRAVVSGEVKAELSVECQRCLEPMQLPVDSQFNLAIVTGPEEAAQLPEELDPLSIEGEDLQLMDLVEDELILGIPSAPLHAEVDCAVNLRELNKPEFPLQVEPEEPTKKNPFAVLSELKSSKDISKN